MLNTTPSQAILIWAEQLRSISWIKNLILLIPVIIYGPLKESHQALHFCIAFFAYNFLSSTVYLMNDVHDKISDQKHKTKRTRPIALGRISKNQAMTVAIILSLISFTLFLYLDLNLFIVGLSYLIANMIYTFWAKNIIWLNLILLSFFHLTRFIAGVLIGKFKPEFFDFWLIFSFFLPLAIASHQEKFLLYWGMRKCINVYRFLGVMFGTSLVIYVFSHGAHLHFKTPQILLILLPILVLFLIRFWKISQQSIHYAYHLVPILKDTKLWLSAMSFLIVIFFAKAPVF